MAVKERADKKSKNFAIRIVNLYKYLCFEKKEYVLSRQVLKSGTSIAANLVESIYGSSKRDFLAKKYISLRECAETEYWIDLLWKTDYISDDAYYSIQRDCLELKKMLVAITKKLKMSIEDSNR